MKALSYCISAPTLEALHILSRSITSPSEISMHALMKGLTVQPNLWVNLVVKIDY